MGGSVSLVLLRLVHQKSFLLLPRLAYGDKSEEQPGVRRLLLKENVVNPAVRLVFKVQVVKNGSAGVNILHKEGNGLRDRT